MSAARRKAISDSLAVFTSQTTSPKPLQILYSTKPNWPRGKGASTTRQAHLDIAVLDSSFNPPTKAHAALALSKPILGPSATSEVAANRRYYDAHLLLFSVRNADKGTGKAGDASTVQRLEMMHLLAHDVEARLQEEGHEASVAVALVEEPLMVAKSTLIHQYLGSPSSSSPSDEQLREKLHWVVGMDTLERFFQVKYYPSPQFFDEACKRFFEQEGTTFVCARRQSDKTSNAEEERAEEDKLLKSDLVAPWVQHGSIAIMDLPTEARGISSTEIRSMSSSYQDDSHEALQQLTSPSIARYLIDEAVYRSS